MSISTDPVDGVIFPTTPVATIISLSLNNISNSSSILILDLSISLVNKTAVEPVIFSIINLEEVLYIQVLTKISFLVLSLSGLSIFSPTFLTVIFSPTEDNLISETGINFDRTPVILNSTLLVTSPPS